MVLLPSQKSPYPVSDHKLLRGVLKKSLQYGMMGTWIFLCASLDLSLQILSYLMGNTIVMQLEHLPNAVHGLLLT